MQIPHLKGLVLIGGRSSRMGFDKSMINYHGLPQVDYLAGLMNRQLGQIYVSCQSGQVSDSKYPVIEDAITETGPMGGVLSSFQFDPESAWLVAACDMPLLSEKTIHQLIKARDPGKLATCFQDPMTGMPEPLFSIWEPAAYLFLQNQISEGNQSLRHALLKGNCKIIMPDHPEELRNANTEEEMREMKERIKKCHFD